MVWKTFLIMVRMKFRLGKIHWILQISFQSRPLQALFLSKTEITYRISVVWIILCRMILNCPVVISSCEKFVQKPSSWTESTFCNWPAVKILSRHISKNWYNYERFGGTNFMVSLLCGSGALTVREFGSLWVRLNLARGYSQERFPSPDEARRQRLSRRESQTTSLDVPCHARNRYRGLSVTFGDFAHLQNLFL